MPQSKISSGFDTVNYLSNIFISTIVDYRGLVCCQISVSTNNQLKTISNADNLSWTDQITPA